MDKLKKCSVTGTENNNTFSFFAFASSSCFLANSEIQSSPKCKTTVTFRNDKRSTINHLQIGSKFQTGSIWSIFICVLDHLIQHNDIFKYLTFSVLTFMWCKKVNCNSTVTLARKAMHSKLKKVTSGSPTHTHRVNQLLTDGPRNSDFTHSFLYRTNYIYKFFHKSRTKLVLNH